MNGRIAMLRRGVREGLRRPVRTLRVVWKRLFPLNALLRDPEAYQAIANWTFGDAPRVPLTELFPGVADIDVAVRRAFDRNPNASLSPGEVLALATIVRLRQPRRILEVGTFEGNTTLNLAANAPADAHVTTLDLPPQFEGTFGLDVPDRMRNPTAPPQVGRQFLNGSRDERIHQVYGDSAVLDWNTLPGPFDLIFIDGCHFEEYVRRDSENAIAHLAPGGIIIWHDYGIIDDVAAVIDDLQSRLQIAVVLGTSLALGTSR